jgi:hypothetical protein
MHDMSAAVQALQTQAQTPHLVVDTSGGVHHILLAEGHVEGAAISQWHRHGDQATRGLGSVQLSLQAGSQGQCCSGDSVTPQQQGGHSGAFTTRLAGKSAWLQANDNTAQTSTACGTRNRHAAVSLTFVQTVRAALIHQAMVPSGAPQHPSTSTPAPQHPSTSTPACTMPSHCPLAPHLACNREEHLLQGGEGQLHVSHAQALLVLLQLLQEGDQLLLPAGGEAGRH